jgi:hypothetical protein
LSVPPHVVEEPERALDEAARPANPADRAALTVRKRILLVAVCAALAAAAGGIRSERSDLDQLVGAARAWMSGNNAYEAVGPGRAVEWHFPLLYPFTAVLAVAPIALLPVPAAWFAGASMALFVWGITSRRELRFAWFALPTFTVIHALRMVQWSPLLTGAALVPGWGFLLACKPTVGGALWLAYPRASSLIGSFCLVVVSLFAWPQWPLAWWTSLQQSSHMMPPAMYWGGPLILLGLLRWRRAEARLLVALSCVPQTAFLYEALPLFLIPRKYEEGLILSLASYAVLVAVQSQVPGWDARQLDPVARYMAERQVMGQWMVWALYLPCLVMVLRRPNLWEDSPEDRPRAHPPGGPVELREQM